MVIVLLSFWDFLCVLFVEFVLFFLKFYVYICLVVCVNVYIYIFFYNGEVISLIKKFEICIFVIKSVFLE